MSEVLTGLDVVVREAAGPTGLRAGSRVGLLAHAASVDRTARHAVEILTAADALHVVRLFAPEHGLYGEAQDMEAVAHGSDPESRLPVVSLYGSDPASLRPTAEDLAGLDGVICDLQDVGSRYYTFVYTLSYVMEAAGAAGIPVVVLDRPNPIGGVEVEGPVLVPDLASFVGRFPLPVRHGMTIGELARLFQGAFGITADLRVVPMVGWRRRMLFEATGLPWVPPSPNMPTPTTATVYPGGCLIEGTNLSEGRGTTLPFELVGAPWIRPRPLVASLRAAGLEGARFRMATFRPTFHKHQGRSCRGVQVLVEDRSRFRPFACYLALIREIRRQDSAPFDWRREPYEFETDRLAIDLLLGRRELRPMLEAGVPVEEMERSWMTGLEAFVDLRRRFLIYGE
jgi:uncharacterized protein YbbC (DUF1343 family)